MKIIGDLIFIVQIISKKHGENNINQESKEFYYINYKKYMGNFE